MRDSSSVPAILSLRSQMRMPSSCSSLKLARSGTVLDAWLGELLSLSCDASTSSVYQTVAWAASENCTEVRSQKSEVRSQKSEVRSQKSEVRRTHRYLLFTPGPILSYIDSMTLPK